MLCHPMTNSKLKSLVYLSQYISTGGGGFSVYLCRGGGYTRGGKALNDVSKGLNMTIVSLVGFELGLCMREIDCATAKMYG